MPYVDLNTIHNPAAGQVAPAAWGDQIRENFESMVAAWVAFTPTLTASTTNPTLGTGGIAKGRYLQVGKTVTTEIIFEFGSAMNAGNGTYRVSFPVPASAGTGTVVVRGSGYILDSSTLTRYLVAAAGLGATFNLLLDGSAAASHALPMAWAQGDQIVLLLTYEAA